MADIQFKRILVTGGAGFLGSHLCTRLVGEGHDVICVDNLFTGQKSNVAHLMDKDNFEFIRHDIREPLQLEGLDQIYNLACPAAPGHYQWDPIGTMKTCILGAINMLDLAKYNGATILQASTSECYGDPLVHPQTEDYRGNVSCTGPRACYDEGKRAAETLFFDHNRMHGTKIRIVRIFNTYGPNLHPYDGRVVSNFIRQALAGEDITIYGDGQQTRSFQYVDDLIEAMIRMVNNEDDFTGPVNTGNPHEFTIRELADIVIRLTNSESKIVHMPAPVDDPVMRRPDITLAKEKLGGWEPTIQLEEGLVKTIEYFANLDLTKWRPPTKNY
ncbi:dTDP-glucose 4,6-dehydratase [Thecamonas trahens ATCC 50062]|uniref:UDP-glucuronic acid decarboxylase 1 n=1 Tax=Thecamonas trahens ATCC 50062 TaxID=461836 RepID=A0A0L0DL13_THETB|nr:dTDP-glucose 4,6-dehydratase [Thecamonas trahens ATCC 50062]KNC52950.1 dTDP-glucose 4,6-dehydratase [Thecamonas trahens ATCC 50062]|eukprot:XP_013754844.1 dTDP-glucose 4,6-dehydratase [Thecamonas trahens ATCC 50062]